MDVFAGIPRWEIKCQFNLNLETPDFLELLCFIKSKQLL